MKPARPLSTYRLQLHAGFTFAHARETVGYLSDLGVSDVYVSPILKAERGSTHGYDVCAYDLLSPELGGEAGFLAFSDSLREHGMRLLVDVVPNHMGIATGENAWWNDVLENGPTSRFAEHFDIDWDPAKTSLTGRVLYPILGAQFGQVLENGGLSLHRSGGAFFVHYAEHELPVAPRSLIPLLELALEGLGVVPREDATDPDVNELQSILTATRHLPDRKNDAVDARIERAREKEVIKTRLAALCARGHRVAGAIDRAIRTYNGEKGAPSSFERLDALLGDQAYRLSFWRVASEEINYRRFFDVNHLVAVRMELPSVFDAAHALLLSNVREGRIDGLRLDHTDGLYDPAAYFASLRANAPGAYVVAEKILEHGEALPPHWPIDGTTGYDALASLNGLWVDGSAESAFTELYARVTGDDAPFAARVAEGKRVVLRDLFASEINLLARELERIAESNRRSRDFTRASLHEAIVETIAALPVYRTYVRPDGSRGATDDRRIEQATRSARRRARHLDPSVFDFLRDVLLLRELDTTGAEHRDRRVAFAMRFQQLSGPIMAKGVEDTALYRYGRFAMLNEVGGDPSRFGTSLSDFHQATGRRAEQWPLSMVATSTHDSKRGEDLRARLAVLSEMPGPWRDCVAEWERRAQRHLGATDDGPAPSALERYFFYQTIVGVWPLEEVGSMLDPLVERVVAYVRKSCREAKLGTSWLRPDEDYERATEAFVRKMLHDDDVLRALRDLAHRTSTYAATNALAQTTVKLTMPGVPDIYQGSELWNQALVDPDSRREVDYEARRRASRAIGESTSDRASLARRLLDGYRDGAVKLYIVKTLLGLRRQYPRLFLDGSYRPIDGGDHVVAFVREHEGLRFACVVPRLSYRLTRGERPWPLGDVWKDRTAAVPAGTWTNALTGEQLRVEGAAPLRDVLRLFPVAALLSDSA